MIEAKLLNLVGREGVEPSTKRLRVSSPYLFPILAQSVADGIVSRNARNRPVRRQIAIARETRLIARHGSLQILEVRHKGKPALRYLAEHQLHAFETAVTLLDNGVTATVPSVQS